MCQRLVLAAPSLRRTVMPLAVGFILLPLVAAGPALAATAAATGNAVSDSSHSSLDAVFGDSIDVRVVNVEVVVTDRRGDRIYGLAPDDLRLKVDGEVVPIEFFTEIRGGVAVEGEDPGPLPGVAPAPGGGRVPTSYLVFLDDVFTLRRDRDRVVRSLAKSIGRLRPGDRMAVVAHSQGGLEMLTSWTDSERELERVLRAVESRPAKGLLRFSAYKQLPSQIPAGISRASLSFAAGQEPTRSIPDRNLRDEAWLNRTVSAASASLRAFADAPGRKVMLLLAGGWQLDEAYSFGESPIGDPFHYVDPYRLIRTFRPLVETANLLGYTVYPVDVPGDLTGFGADVAGRAPSALSPFGFDRNLEIGLHYVAEGTGGRAMVDGLRLRALDEVVADTASFYWLGFTPGDLGDDRPRRIEVDAVRPGLSVRTRDSFRELEPWMENGMMVESALLFGELPADGVLEVSTGPLEMADDGTMILPLEVRVPLSEVSGLPADGGWAVRLETLVAARDDRGRRSGVVSRPIELYRASEPVAGELALYETRLVLARRPHELVVAVHDPIARHNLFARVAVAP